MEQNKKWDSATFYEMQAYMVYCKRILTRNNVHELLLPIMTIVLSVLIGKNGYWGRLKWFSSIVFGVMYMLAEYATFSVANMKSFGNINMLE